LDEEVARGVVDYTPGAVTIPRVGVSYYRPIGKKWSFIANVDYSPLPDEIKMSPLVEPDTDGTATIFIGFSRGFTPGGWTDTKRDLGKRQLCPVDAPRLAFSPYVRLGYRRTKARLGVVRSPTRMRPHAASPLPEGRKTRQRARIALWQRAGDTEGGGRTRRAGLLGVPRGPKIAVRMLGRQRSTTQWQERAAAAVHRPPSSSVTQSRLPID